MERLLLPLVVIVSANIAKASDVQELSYRKTFADLTWNGTFSMQDVSSHTVQLDGLRYKSMYWVGPILAGYELGMAGVRGAHADYGSAPYLGTFNSGLTSSIPIISPNKIGMNFNLSLGLEYVSVSSGLTPSGNSLNLYSNLGPSLYVPVQGGKVGLSVETYFSHFDGARTLQGGAMSFFISNEF